MERHRGEGYAFTAWAAYLVCNLMWPEWVTGWSWFTVDWKKEMVQGLPRLGYHLYP